MKKFLLSLAVLAASAFTLSAQETLTVHDGYATSNTIPAYVFYWDDFTRCQTVYPAEELQEMVGGSINSLTFYHDQTNAYTSASTADVYLMEVDYTTINAFEPKANATTVYTGSLVFAADGTATIEFTTPYTYSGGNLLVGIENTTDAGYKNIKFYGENITGASVSGYNASSLDNVTATQRGFIPKTTFTYEPGQLADYAAEVKITELNFGKANIGDEKEMTVTLKNKGALAFTPSVSSLQAPFSTAYEAAELASKETVEIPVKFAPTALGEYTGTMTINCGEAGTFEVTLNGSCVNEVELTICDGTNQSQIAPIFGYNMNIQGVFTQMLYPATMLTDVAGAKITGVKFYASQTIEVGTPTIELSMKETDETSYVRESAIAAPSNLVTDLTLVATKTLTTGETELEFAFDEPFSYEGNNLAIQTLAQTAGTWKRTYFYGISTDDYTAYSEYGGSGNNEIAQFLPKMTIIYTKAEPVVETVTVTGTVTDQSTEETIEGVTVTLTVNAPAKEGEATTYTATTNAEGVYTMEVTPVEGATYDMTFEKEGYVAKTIENVSLEEPQNVSLNQTTITGISDVNVNNAVSVKYINAMGQVSNRPFEGINIVVTRNADGSTTTTKVVK